MRPGAETTARPFTPAIGEMKARDTPSAVLPAAPGASAWTWPVAAPATMVSSARVANSAPSVRCSRLPAGITAPSWPEMAIGPMAAAAPTRGMPQIAAQRSSWACSAVSGITCRAIQFRKP